MNKFAVSTQLTIGRVFIIKAEDLEAAKALASAAIDDDSIDEIAIAEYDGSFETELLEVIPDGADDRWAQFTTKQIAWYLSVQAAEQQDCRTRELAELYEAGILGYGHMTRTELVAEIEEITNEVGFEDQAEEMRNALSIKHDKE